MKRAFTAIELLVVCLIIGIIAVAVIPNLDSFFLGYGLKAVARRVASLQRTARSEAIISARYWGLLYNLDEGYACILRPPDDSQGEQPSADWEQVLLFSLPSDVEFETINFGRLEYRTGFVIVTVSPTGFYSRHSVVLRSEDGSAISVVSNPFLGICNFHEGVYTLDYEEQ